MPDRETTTIYNDLLAEGIHTAFRKASDHPASAEAWEAISKLPDAEWSAIVSFILAGAAAPTK